MAKATFFQEPIPENERIFYYDSLEDDPIKTKEQEHKEKVLLPEDYEFIPKNPFKRMYYATWFGMFVILGLWYEFYYWGLKLKGREKLKGVSRKQGFMLYCNHTNPYHDVFGPGLMAGRRIFTVVSPVNLKLPGIGKIVPAIGGLPLGTSPKTKKGFHEAVDKRLAQGHGVVVYPEAHVWPYATMIRPFPAGDRSFVYVVRNKVPMFVMTTTYRRSKKKGDERPRMTAYLDGPFYTDPKKSDAENQADLAQKAYESMVKYSKENSYEYFRYRPKSTKKR